jgi:hypothetical protein
VNDEFVRSSDLGPSTKHVESLRRPTESFLRSIR